MNDVATNKRLAREYLERIGQGDVDGVVELFDDDAWARIACPTVLVYCADSWASDPSDDGRAEHFERQPSQCMPLPATGYITTSPTEFVAESCAFLAYDRSTLTALVKNPASCEAIWGRVSEKYRAGGEPRSKGMVTPAYR